MSSVHIPTTSEIEQKWDQFSNAYIKYMEPITKPLSHVLVNNIFYDQSKVPKSILEIACGGGAGTELLLHYKPNSTKVISTDLSQDMLNLTKKRLNIPLDATEDTKRNLTLMKVDSENLPFPNESFDRYIASLCLHIVNDPDKMLRESLRVLEKGGIAAFSVWGTLEKNNKFTILPLCASKVGIESSAKQVRSHFYLNDVELLRKMAKDAGFSKVLGGYSYSNDLAQNGQEFVDAMFSTPEMVEKEKSMTPELYSKWQNEVRDYVDNLYSQGKFVGFEIAYIICTK